ncbi:MAG: hypothetical protein FWF06_02065 [Symbiobacteriaceae bacterium]|nr:hypothetical protein [Symbiobacteriaceae bacterium]
MVQRIAHPIRIVTVCNEEGVITPIRFQVEDETEERFTIIVDKVLKSFEDKQSGARIRRFLCQSVIENRAQQYELSMEIASTRWFITQR